MPTYVLRLAPWAMGLSILLSVFSPAMAAAETFELGGSNRWGSRGLRFVEAGHAVHSNALILQADANIAYATGFLVAADHDLWQRESLHVLWSPFLGFEVGVSESLVTNRYQSFFTRQIQSIGNPALDLKYTYKPLPAAPQLGVGVAAHVWVPTALHTQSLVFSAAAMQLVALGTYAVVPRTEVSVNLGYLRDQSNNLVGDNAVVPAEQRFALGLDSVRNHISYGVGAARAFDLTGAWVIEPFAEISGALGVGRGATNNPSRASVGAKVYSSLSHMVEVGIGADVRITGAPSAGRAGSPPWTAFASAALHLFDHDADKLGCNADHDCSQGQVCDQHVCTVLKEIREEVVREVVRDHATFNVVGTVTDNVTGAALQEATVTIGGYADTPLSVEYKTGGFKSFPVPTGPGILQITAVARGYKPKTVTVARGAANSEVKTVFALERDDSPTYGHVRGSIVNGHTGTPVVGATLFVASEHQKVFSDAKGLFELQVRVGQHDLLISAPGYATQRHRVNLHDGETVILNVDLSAPTQ